MAPTTVARKGATKGGKALTAGKGKKAIDKNKAGGKGKGKGKGKGGKRGRKGKKKKKKTKRCPIKRRRKARKRKCTDMFEPTAMLNLYYIAHAIGHALPIRKFKWKKPKKPK